MQKIFFRKIMLKPFCLALVKVCPYPKMRILTYLFLNMNKHNEINITQSSLAMKVKTSNREVNRVMSLLQKENMIKKIAGLYVVNPEIIQIFSNTTENNLAIEAYAKGELYVKPTE